MRGLASLLVALLALAAAAPCRGQEDPKALLEDLVTDLGSENEYVRTLARDRLATMEGDAGVARMTGLLDGAGPARTRAEAARVLARLGSRATAAIPALRRVVLEDPAGDLGTAALDALCAINPGEPFPVSDLAAMLESGEERRVEIALVAIARMGVNAAPLEAPLARLLGQLLAIGETPVMCGRVASALGATGGTSKETVAALTDYAVAGAKSGGDAIELGEARHAVPLVLGELIRRGTDPGQRWVQHLAGLAGAKPGDAIVELASSGTQEQRLSAIRLLESMGPAARGAIDALIASLADPSAAIRRAAADAIGAIGREARPAVPALLGVLRDRESRACFWAARALGAVCGGGDVLGSSTRAERREAGAKAGRGTGLTENAVELGLKWLADHQDVDEDGKWDCDDFMKHDPVDDKCDGAGGALYDIGVTGLAILGFLGAGYTDRGSAKENKYAKNVRAGLRYLMESQADDGVFGTRATHAFMYNHAIATLAMCEAFWMTGDPRYRKPAQDGLDFIAMARNPQLAWRYEPRGGENDTTVTGWCVMALKSATYGGLVVPPDALEGARRWIGQVTEPRSGRVGYNRPGGMPARPEGMQDRFPPEKSNATTGVGILCRIFLGEDPKTSEMIRRGAELCVGLPPKWNPDDGSIDMYYWYYATLALFQVGGTHWKTWNEAMVEALVKHQHLPESGSRGGSWDPLCAWGHEGGRVYSTAMLVMCLEVYYRYERIGAKAHVADPMLEEVLAALAEAATDSDSTLAKAASDALARIGPGPVATARPPAVEAHTTSYSLWRAEYIEYADRGDWSGAWRHLREAVGKPFLFHCTVTNRVGNRVTVRLGRGNETVTVDDPALLAAIRDGAKAVLYGYVETSAKTTQELTQRGTSLRMEFGYLSE